MHELQPWHESMAEVKARTHRVLLSFRMHLQETFILNEFFSSHKGATFFSSCIKLLLKVFLWDNGDNGDQSEAKCFCSARFKKTLDVWIKLTILLR